LIKKRHFERRAYVLKKLRGEFSVKRIGRFQVSSKSSQRKWLVKAHIGGLSMPAINSQTDANIFSRYSNFSFSVLQKMQTLIQRISSFHQRMTQVSDLTNVIQQNQNQSLQKFNSIQRAEEQSLQQKSSIEEKVDNIKKNNMSIANNQTAIQKGVKNLKCISETIERQVQDIKKKQSIQRKQLEYTKEMRERIYQNEKRIQLNAAESGQNLHDVEKNKNKIQSMMKEKQNQQVSTKRNEKLYHQGLYQKIMVVFNQAIWWLWSMLW
jgi:chromosome segregation ATPase